MVSRRPSCAVALRPTVIAAALALSLPAMAQTADASAPTTQLKEIVVSASGFEQDVKEAPASITVITREELDSKRTNSLAHVLEDVEGVDVGDSAGKTGGLNISMRGMPSEYTLVLIDGRRQNSAGQITPNGFGETSTSFLPPPSAIERIEIIRGPMSTLYGSDAMGGVINIITRKVAKTWGGSVTVEGTVQTEGMFGDSVGGNFYLAGPLVADRLGLAIRGGTTLRDASDISYVDAAGATVVGTQGRNPTESDLYNVGARLSLAINKDHDLSLDVDSSRQTYDNSRGQLGTLGSGGYTAQQKYNREQYALTHDARLGFGTLQSSLMQNTTETIGRTIPNGTPGAIAGGPRTLQVENLVLDSKLVAAVGSSHILSIGGQWWDAKMVDGVAPAPYKHEQWALFAEDEWRLTDALALTLGARYDRHSVFGGQVSPRAYLVWGATDTLTVKGGMARGYKTPRLDQLADGITGFSGQGTVPNIGSPGLKPETSTSTEVGVYYDNRDGVQASAMLFNNEFDDKIASGPGLLNCTYAADPNRPGCVNYGNWPNLNTFGQSINVDKAVTRGFELATRVPLAANLGLSANYTFTKSEQKSGANAGKPLTNTPRHMLNARLQWQASEATSAWVRGEYRSKRFRDPGTSASTQAAKNALGDYRGYALLHVGASHKVTKDFTVNAAMHNVFNKNFVDYHAYTSGTSTNYDNTFVNPLEGRRITISANLQF